MGQLVATKILKTDKETEELTLTRSFTQVINHVINLDDSDTFTLLLTSGKAVGMNQLPTAKYMLLINEGIAPIEINITLEAWKTNSGTNGDDGVDAYDPIDLDSDGGTSDTSNRYLNFIIPGGEHYEIPSIKWLSSQKVETRANATFLDGINPTTINSSARKVDTTADNSLSSVAGATGLTINQVGFLKAGDLVQLQDEIIKLEYDTDTLDTDLGTGSNALYVERGLLGSTSVTQGVGVDVYLYYQNNLFKFGSTDYRGGGDGTGTEVIKTDFNGEFLITNFFGYGRSTSGIADGVVPGSVAIQFMNPSHQKFGLSGISSSTKHGLTLGSQYAFKVNDSGGGLEEISFTVSTTNGTFGGPDGLVNTIQLALNTAYNGTGNLKGRQIYVSLENGDLVFKNENRTSGSSLVFDNPSVVTNMFGAGIFPAVGSLGDNRGSYFAPLYKHDPVTYVQTQSQPDMIVDDGKGNIGNGTINYETGALHLKNCPSNSEMKVWASVNSGFSGGNSLTTNGFNQWKALRARSVNARMQGKLRILAYE
tara:strand:- start:37291 stop:38901 length:1611 start_codon:yes stop_codon:yes gene_type:complete